MCQKLLKEGNVDQRHLRCPDLRGKTFDVISSSISLDKFVFYCAETVKAKPTGNDSCFITYSKIINFACKWLDKSGYLNTQCTKFVKEQAITWFKKLGSKFGKLVENMTS